MVDSSSDPARPGRATISAERFGILLFLAMETMFFAGLVGTYIVLRNQAGADWRPEGFEARALGLPLSNLVVLTLSSVFLLFGTRALRREDPGGLSLHVGLALCCGVAFVVVQVVELDRLAETILPLEGRTIFPSVFYACSALHGLHVAVGVLILLWVWIRALLGRYHQYRRVGVDLASAYWHFVVVVWWFFYFILYVT